MGAPPPLGDMAVPVEGVVPDLGGVVEQRPPSAARMISSSDASASVGALDQLVEVGDVGLVVLAVVVLERLGGDVRRERVLGVGQRGEFEGHGVVPRAVFWDRFEWEASRATLSVSIRTLEPRGRCLPTRTSRKHDRRAAAPGQGRGVGAPGFRSSRDAVVDPSTPWGQTDRQRWTVCGVPSAVGKLRGPPSMSAHEVVAVTEVGGGRRRDRGAAVARCRTRW